MALVPAALRSLIIHLNWFPKPIPLPFLYPPAIASFLPHFSKHPLSLPRCYKPSLNPKTLEPQSHPSPQGYSLILRQDKRFEKTQTASRSTIAAIVTSLGGPPAAVGIVRLSGPSAVEITGKVFRPVRKRRRKKKQRQDEEKDEEEKRGGSCLWQPMSHVVEYGVVLDCSGNVVDEVKLHFSGGLKARPSHPRPC